ncbi:MAG: ABC transporter permease [Erysipelotrichaceae bacterium]
MIALIHRHLLLFFKDKSAIFFSLMAVFVVIGLYVSFLGEMMIQPLVKSFGEGARELSDYWIIAGTLGTVALTTSLSAMNVMIEDRSNQIVKDFYVSPIGNLKIMLSYFISTFLITFIISIVALIIGESYIVYYGGHCLSILTLLKLFAAMTLIIITCVTILLALMLPFQSISAFSNITTIVGTLSGFLMGIYVPIGVLPLGLQKVIRMFPISHGASLYRKIMMEDVMQRIFKGVNNETIEAFRINFGLDFVYQNFKCNSQTNVLILILTALFFMIPLCIVIKKRHLK